MELQKRDRIAITGAGGFIGGNLVKYFRDKELTRIRAVDKKPFREWYLRIPEAENICLDCSNGGRLQGLYARAQQKWNKLDKRSDLGLLQGLARHSLLLAKEAGRDLGK